jgi:hypothetical protein
MTAHCPDCYVEVSPTARDGRCSSCRPSRRHSEPREKRMDPASRFQQMAHRHNEQVSQ